VEVGRSSCSAAGLLTDLAVRMGRLVVRARFGLEIEHGPEIRPAVSY